MSESRKLLLDRIERDPETRHLAPIMRVLLALPTSEVSLYLGLASYWAALKYDRRATFVVSLMEQDGLTVGKIAALCGVNRRTLYKSDFFRNVLRMWRRKRKPDSQDPGLSGGEGDDDSDRWDDD
jgi:hypothetical protein